MSMHDPDTPFPDEQIIAFLDGELPSADRRLMEDALILDEALRARLAGLDTSSTVLKRAGASLDLLVPAAVHLDELLESARWQVEEALEPARDPYREEDLAAVGAEDPDLPPARLSRTGAPSEAGRGGSRARAPEWWVMVASIVVAFALGNLVPWTVGMLASNSGSQGTGPSVSGPALVPPAADHSSWKQAVAEHITLYTARTFERRRPHPDLAQHLVSAGRAIGLALTPQGLSVPGYQLLDAELLVLKGMPLAKVTYLDETGFPLVFCVIRGPVAAQTNAPALGTQNGLSLVAWDREGLGYVVIGDAPQERLATLARGLIPRFF